MEDALYDVYLAQALSQTDPHYATSESKDSLFARVLAKYHITQADFDSSIVFYSNKGEVYYKINNHVSKRLQDLKKSFGDDDEGELNAKFRRIYDGFTLPPSVWLGGRGCPSSFGFEIDSLKFGNTVDTTAFDFNFRVLGVASNASAYAEVCFEYKDTTVRVYQKISYNTSYSIKKPLNIRHKLKNIAGYIRVENVQMQVLPIFIYELHYKKVKIKPRPKMDSESGHKKSKKEGGYVFGINKNNEVRKSNEEIMRGEERRQSLERKK